MVVRTYPCAEQSKAEQQATYVYFVPAVAARHDDVHAILASPDTLGPRDLATS